MVRKGKTIFKEGDPVEGIYFMYTGWVKIHKEWTHPKELILRFAGAGEIIGHRGTTEGGKKDTRPGTYGNKGKNCLGTFGDE